MTDPKEAPREFLNEALSALERLDSDRTELGQLRQQTMSDERALKELGSSCEKEKQQLINERRSSLKADFDKQLRSLDKELKTVSDKRKKARQKGVKSRIKDETAELRSQNVQKQKSIRELHTKSGLSRLTELNGKHKELEAAMEQALLNFDKVTKCVLSDEVDAKYKTKLDELSEALKERKLSEEKKQAEISKEEQELLDYAKETWKAEGNKVKDLQSIELYYKPEEGKCYYVFNGQGSDDSFFSV